MNKITRIKNVNYTTISNVFLRDKKLSLKAKGFLAVVMSLPDDWDFSINGICAVLPEGKTAIYSTIKELKDNGYCEYSTSRDDKGRMIGNDYTFYENSKNYQDCDEPHAENPHMDNQTQLSIDIEEYKEKKKEKSLSISYTDIKTVWNNECGKICSLSTITIKRQEKIRTRFKEFESVGEPMSVFTTIVKKISSSHWIMEQSRENWRKKLFDWIFDNSENWVKVWEGQYDSQKTNSLFDSYQQEQYEYDRNGNKVKIQDWQ